jgi:hypothetical protein
MRFNRWLVHPLSFPLFAAAFCVQGAVTELTARFTPVPPFPALVSVARTNQILLNQIENPSAGEAINPGDSLTALVTFCEKNGRRTQWLLHLEATTPEAREQPSKPARPMVMYSSTGNKLEFVSSPAFVTLRTLGPFAESDANSKPLKTLDKSARFALDKGFLSLGLDRAAAVVLRLNQVDPNHERKGSFAFNSKPFSEIEITKNRKVAAVLQLTAEDERALAGSAPALMSYFAIVQQTAGLDDILFKILDLPSLWSMIRHGGVNANIRFDTQHIAMAPDALLTLPTNPKLYQFPVALDLNNQPALNITFLATAPQPPLLTCGGIVGMLVERPDGKGTYLTLRVISARRSATKR